MTTNEYHVFMSDGQKYKVDAKCPEDAIILASADAIRVQGSREVRKMEQVCIPKGDVLFEKIQIFVIYDDTE